MKKKNSFNSMGCVFEFGKHCAIRAKIMELSKSVKNYEEFDYLNDLMEESYENEKML